MQRSFFHTLFLLLAFVVFAAISFVSLPRTTLPEVLALGTGSILDTSTPQITHVDTTHWTEGSSVRITGNNLGTAIPTQGQFCFTSTSCTTSESFRALVVSWNNTEIQLQIPRISLPAQGTLEVLLPHPTTGTYQWLTVTPYTFASRQPRILSQEIPAQVIAGSTQLTITGEHLGTFTPGTDQLCFNNICPTAESITEYIDAWTPTSFRISIPAFVTGTSVHIRIFKELYKDIRTGSSVTTELVLTPVPLTPAVEGHILSVTPYQHIIPGSTIVTITGKGFGNQFTSTLHRICFGTSCLPVGTEQTFITTWSDTEIRLRVPDSVASLTAPHITLHIYNARNKTYDQLRAPVPLEIAQLPHIQRYFPTMETGLAYYIEGSDFGTTTGNIQIGSTTLDIISWSPTTIHFRIPNTTSTGALRVTTNSGYQSAPLAVEIRQIARVTRDPLAHYQWYLEQLGVPEAWKTSTGNSDVVVAVIDSGIDTTHEDILSALWKNTKEIAGNGKDDDGNGYIDDIYGWDFVRNSPSLRPLNPHGTQVASIIAAGQNNTVGISGIAPSVRIMSLDITTRESDGSMSVDVDAVQEAILYAVDNGASVINLSFGGVANTPVYAEVLQYAYDRNVVVIAAAGNMRLNLDHTFFTPICETGTGILSLGVASVGKTFGPSPFSNFGNRCVGISAPGEEIIGAIPMEQAGEELPYSINEGTSFAAPIVSGAAALLRSVHPDWNAEEIYAALQAQTYPIRTITDQGFGSGVIDFRTLLTQARPLVSYTPSGNTKRPQIQATNQRIALPDPTPITPAPLPESSTSSQETPAATSALPFTDITSTHQYASAITYLHEQGIIQGYSDGTFRPTQAINRAEFLKIIFESNGARVADSFANCFPDVHNQWFARYVCLAKTLEIVQGYEDGMYRPEQTINKVEALKILFALYRLPLEASSSPFMDVAVDSWYTPYVQTAHALGILEETGTTRFFRPAQTMSRGMMAEWLYRLHTVRAQ